MGRRVKKPLSQEEAGPRSQVLVFSTSLAARQQREEAGSHSHPTRPHSAPEGRARVGPGFLAADSAFQKRHPGPSAHPPPPTHKWEMLASSLLCGSIRQRIARPKRLTTEADRRGWMDLAGPAGSRLLTHTHTHSRTSVRGRGCRTSLAGLGCPPSLGSRPKPPTSPSQAGKGLTPTFIVRVKSGLLLLSKGGWFTLEVPGCCPSSSQKPDRTKSEGLLGT